MDRFTKIYNCSTDLHNDISESTIAGKARAALLYLQKASKYGTLPSTTAKVNYTKDAERANVNSVGKIDKVLYSCVSPDIISDEVIITDKQIAHIKERHPNNYEQYCQYFAEIISAPDYIIEANKPNTAVILKEIKTTEETFKAVLRLVTSTDPNGYKNSIITFMKLDEKNWTRLLRNKKILYKKE